MEHNINMQENILKTVIHLDNNRTQTTYTCKKCYSTFGNNLTAIQTHLNSKKPCDEEIKMLKLIKKYNISDDDKKYKCGKCKKYETTVRHTFYKHITRKQSCDIKEETIDNRIIVYKNNNSYVKSSDGKRDMRICDECIKEKKISYAKGGNLCQDHGGKIYIPKTCKWEEDCDKKATHEGYCLEHYKMIDKEDKILQCRKCKDIFSDKRTLNKHLENIDCLKNLETDEKYKDNKLIIDGYTKYKCLFCNNIFKDLTALKRHESTNKSCKEEQKIKEKVIENKFINENGKTNYQCLKCDKIFRDRTGYIRHIDGSRDCNPNYEVKCIDGKMIVFKENNKYSVTYSNGKKSENLVCKENDCYLCATNGGYCASHGGTHKKYYCEYEDEDGKCDKLCKVYIDGIKYCIFHGGQPQLKECAFEGCNKLIHSATFCTKHKINKRLRNKDEQKKYKR